jgi:hypothetical protein
MSILLIIFALLLNQPDFTVKSVKKEYPRMFRIYSKTTEDGKQFIAEVKLVPKEHPFYELILNNRHLLDYLVKNAIDYNGINEYLNDSLMLEMDFYTRLDTNSAFNDALLNVIGSYLKSKGKAITDYTPETEEMLYEQLATRAVRFFEPYRVDDNGMVLSNILVNNSSFKDYEGLRNFIAEGFCYQALFMETYKKKHNLNKVFSQLLQDLTAYPFSQDEDTKIKRLQGALWFSFAKDPAIKAVIKDEYNRLKSWYPISILDLK